jgi:hypothetical protein
MQNGRRKNLKFFWEVERLAALVDKKKPKSGFNLEQ